MGGGDRNTCMGGKSAQSSCLILAILELAIVAILFHSMVATFIANKDTLGPQKAAQVVLRAMINNAQ